MRYKQKPLTVEAFRYEGNTDNFPKWAMVALSNRVLKYLGKELYVITLDGRTRVAVGDYIVKGAEHEIFPGNADKFERTYDEV